MTEVTPWYQGVEGFDTEAVGHLTSRGWDKLDAPKAAAAAIKSFREAERMIGAPPSEMVRLPKDPADAAGWRAVHVRLGAPAEAKDYDFSAIKKPDGGDLDAAFVDTVRKSAFESGLSKDAASRVVSAIVKQQSDATAAADVERQAKLAAEKTTLKTSWGANEAAHMFVAQRAAAALGVKPENIAALEGVIGYAAVMEMFRTIGSKIGEDKFVMNSGPGGGSTLTREQAVAKKAELMADGDWTKRYMNGGAPEKREMEAVLRIITGN